MGDSVWGFAQWVVPQFAADRAAQTWGCLVVAIAIISPGVLLLSIYLSQHNSSELTQIHNERTSLTSFRFAFFNWVTFFSFWKLKNWRPYYTVSSSSSSLWNFQSYRYIGVFWHSRSRPSFWSKTLALLRTPPSIPIGEQQKSSSVTATFVFVIVIYLCSW